MKPKEQRIAIAKFCGWEYRKNDIHPKWDFWYSPVKSDEHKYSYEQLPDYLNDLNAMREAALILNDRGLGTEYCVALRRIVVRDAEKAGFGRNESLLCDIYFYEATAAQRAEAFLKTINKWTE